MNESLPTGSDAIELVLNRHAARRAAGLPTVSVLVGPVGAGISAFRTRAGDRGQAVHLGSSTNLAEVTSLFVQATAAARDLADDTCSYLAARTGRLLPELRAALGTMTRHDLNQFFAANDTQLPPGDGTRFARCVWEAIVAGQSPATQWPLECAGPLAALSGLTAVIPIESIPAVLLTPPASRDVREWFHAAGGVAVAVATHVPKIPIAVVIPPTEWCRYLADVPESRVKAFLREGAIELPVMSPREIEQLLTRFDPTRIPDLVRTVVVAGVSSTFATAFATAATTPPVAATAEEDDAARSAAERFLYEFLELLPATAGRFELNGEAGFRFGPRAAEVDLLARDLQIAIEIDGYFHFRDLDNYRRDREKDWELQRRGFLVLRFLADDLLPRLEDVRDRILAAVVLRTARNTA